ncbi:hypothetical protein K503DRAFT_828051 [Rhizopogon vinicolor AM-OR11-026]|uniref:Uncharacterized protein n=1 Tax=Rhizopogon vinicolor AM-OR11-026 TaxID=1314800 RepID=A0A1B7NCC7_9AGAM|nr:hypothetical protein K503DRAFT_828051 [Rhizopogon vinicolor AM-OR11-026]
MTTPPFRASQRESKLFSLCLFQPGLRGKCKNKCDGENCCNKRILKRQPDFYDQKSLVQEVIEAAGHLCMFFFCRNFIAS